MLVGEKLDRITICKGVVKFWYTLRKAWYLVEEITVIMDIERKAN